MKFIVIDNPRFWSTVLRHFFKIKKVNSEESV